MTRPATSSPLTRATEALRVAERKRNLTALVITDGAIAGHLPDPDLIDRFKRDEAAVEYAHAVLKAELEAAQEVAA